MITHVKRLAEAARRSRQRRVVVLTGSSLWGETVANTVCASLTTAGLLGQSVLWVGAFSQPEKASRAVHFIRFNQADQWLGKEVDGLIINAWSGFDVNGFGALTGTLKAGGLLFMIVPPLANWSNYQDPEHIKMAVYPIAPDKISGRYLQRLAQLIKGSGEVSLVEESGVISDRDQGSSSVANLPLQSRTVDQVKAITAIKKVARGHRRRPLVLTADRGRGKSAALGMAAAVLLKEGAKKILVTAPALSAVEVLFRHGAEELDVTYHKSGVVNAMDGQLLFKAPDELAADPVSGDLLLVDEAAAVPVALLTQLLKHYSRIVFSSTIHGYEGTGRGFAVRFQGTLDQLTPQWRHLHLSEPVRWAEGDPLEKLTFSALLLDAAPVDSQTVSRCHWSDGIFEKLDRDALVRESLLLNELFGLLVLAHYKTTPMDLRQLLDGSNLSVYALRLAGHVLATVLVATEGRIDTQWTDGIWRGQRRVRGHVLPQSLSNHVGLRDAIELKGARIIRLAVHPEFQQQGIGLSVMTQLVSVLQHEGFDYVGCLFGATPELLDFWQKAGLAPVRIGLNREAASGAHSVMMLKGLTGTGHMLTEQATRRFAELIPYVLSDGLRYLDVAIVIRLLADLQSRNSSGFTSEEQAEMASFASGQRLYESCIVVIKKAVWSGLGHASFVSALSKDDQVLLVKKVIQGQPWQHVIKGTSLAGSRQAINRLRHILRRVVSL